jgi:pSer/pThr/pTyr-binding forkhead associated (FHA) protein
MTDAHSGLDAPIPTPAGRAPGFDAPPRQAARPDDPLPVPVGTSASRVLALLIEGPDERASVRLTAPTLTIGRHDAREGITPDLDLSEHEPPERRTVSRRHAEVHRVEDGYRVVDMGSANGTFRNDTRLEPGRPTPFNEGDTLRFGRVLARVLADG